MADVINGAQAAEAADASSSQTQPEWNYAYDYALYRLGVRHSLPKAKISQARRMELQGEVLAAIKRAGYPLPPRGRRHRGVSVP